MHYECKQYVRRYATLEELTVVEVGSRNVNGGVRDLFPNCRYTGIDLKPGPGVDIATDATLWNPPGLVDLVICTEVLEHEQNWKRLISHCVQWLLPGGRIIITCAGPGREPHSAIDGGPLRMGEYYGNIILSELAIQLRDSGVFSDSLEYLESSCDVRASGIAEFGSV